MKRNKISCRNDAFCSAKKYAKNYNYIMASIWLIRADGLAPLTEIQAWSFKNIVGLDKYLEIAPKRLLEFDFVK